MKFSSTSYIFYKTDVNLRLSLLTESLNEYVREKYIGERRYEEGRRIRTLKNMKKNEYEEYEEAEGIRTLSSYGVREASDSHSTYDRATVLFVGVKERL